MPVKDFRRIPSNENQSPKMPYNASFSAPKPLPGSKKEFPKVSARVYSFSKPEHLLKPRDSGNVTESEKTVPSAPGRVAIRTAQRWDNTTKVTVTTNIKPLPGTKKTLEDFVRKPFKATPVPASTYKAPADHLAPKTKPQTKIVKKAIAKEDDPLATTSPSVINSELAGAATVDVEDTLTENTSVVTCDEQVTDGITFADASDTSEKSMAGEEASMESLVEDEAVVSQENLPVTIIPEAGLDEAIVQDESLAIACVKPCLSSPVLAEVSDVIQQEPAFAPVVTDALANEAPVKKGKKQRSQNDNPSPKKKLPKRAKGSKASAKPCVRDDFLKQEPSVASVVPTPDGKDAPVETDKKHKPHYGNAWYQKKMEKRLNERTQRAALKETAQFVETVQ
ncbi:Uncharacterized protein APZ42_033056 [Daphnia magna]|uniref:Uncharacterized protein n=1 Tax=Daphnia magna TaxID=35525 RepID=A0A164LHI5_9CRUS|nr:Uncharacterized protein APZ42_033056 [Daphnia magna]